MHLENFWILLLPLLWMSCLFSSDEDDSFLDSVGKFVGNAKAFSVDIKDEAVTNEG